jgi:hypothetical protein
MKSFLSAFFLTTLVSSTVLAKVVSTGEGLKNDPPNMALMLELQETFANASPVTIGDLVLGKNWNCTSTHYYRDPAAQVWSFANHVNNEVDQIGDSNAKKYVFNEKGLIANHRYEGWDYEYLDSIRKTNSGLIVERSINPAAQPYQFVSATDAAYFTWAYFVCN